MCLLIYAGPCAGNTPHVHPRGSEISFVLYGSMQFGMIEENAGNNALVLQNITQNDTIHIPQGEEKQKTRFASENLGGIEMVFFRHTTRLLVLIPRHCNILATVSKHSKVQRSSGQTGMAKVFSRSITHREFLMVVERHEWVSHILWPF